MELTPDSTTQFCNRTWWSDVAWYRDDGWIFIRRPVNTAFSEILEILDILPVKWSTIKAQQRTEDSWTTTKMNRSHNTSTNSIQDHLQLTKIHHQHYQTHLLAPGVYHLCAAAADITRMKKSLLKHLHQYITIFSFSLLPLIKTYFLESFVRTVEGTLTSIQKVNGAEMVMELTLLMMGFVDARIQRLGLCVTGNLLSVILGYVWRLLSSWSSLFYLLALDYSKCMRLFDLFTSFDLTSFDLMSFYLTSFDIKVTSLTSFGLTS